MALHRREGSRNMLRGVLAFFWIALAGVSGVYLYSAFANPTALSGQLANPLPVGSGEMTSAVNGSGARDQELAEIKASLRQLTQQMAAISTKLNLDPGALASAEDFGGLRGRGRAGGAGSTFVPGGRARSRGCAAGTAAFPCSSCRASEASRSAEA